MRFQTQHYCLRGLTVFANLNPDLSATNMENWWQGAWIKGLKNPDERNLLFSNSALTP